MKILHIIPSLRKGGAERYVLDLCLELNKRPNIEYQLLVLSDEDDYKYLSSDVKILKMEEPFVPSILRKSIVNVAQYQSLIENYRPDIIHTHLFSAEIFTSIYVPRNIAFVVHGHDNMRQFRKLSLSTFSERSKLTEFYEKQLLINNKYKKNSNTYFIANSPDTFSYFQNVVPKFLKKNVKLIEIGFDFNRFFYPEKSYKPTRSNFSIVNVGSYVEKKNHKFIIDIAQILKNKGFKFEINLLGSGELVEQIKQLIIHWKLEDCVFVRGNVDYVEEWLDKADIYLHTAYYEPFGLVLLEAMAAGLPCVILDGKGNRNLVRDDYNGYLFSEQNAKLFAYKIIEIADDIKLLEKLSRNAQDFAETYDIARKTDELIEFYQSIILKI